MNPQPEPYIGHIFAFLFVIYTLYNIWKVYSSNSTQANYDLFTLGYIEDNPTHNTTIIVKENNKRNNFESEQIYADCIDALHALGMRKIEAKKRAKYIFSSMNSLPNSVQEFLMIALRKDL